MKELAALEQQQSRLVIHQEPNPLAGTPAYMLQLAVEKGADLATIEKFMDLNDRFEANLAKKAYLSALAEFKKDPPKVYRDLVNKQYGSKYTSLANLVNTVNEALGKYGLNAAWSFDQASGIKVTCVLSHVMGHKEEVSLTAPPDTSGSKNPIQQIKSTITYLEAATFQAVTGIVSREASVDDDGNAASSGLITDDQAMNLQALADEVKANIPKFLKYVGAAEINLIKAKDYDRAVSALEKKRKAS